MGVLNGQAAVPIAVIPSRQAEDLRRREEELEDFFENAALGLHLVGPDGIILRANRAELEMLGYSRDEYVGRHVAEFHVDQPVIDEILGCLTRGETIHEQPARLRCKDGSVRDVVISSNVLFRDGKFVHTRCFTRDITDQRISEKALSESERRFRDMIDALPAAIYTTDAQGRLTHYNPAAVEFSGRKPELGSDHWCVSWKLYYPDGTPMPHGECPMAVALKEGITVRGAVAIAERPDGERVWFTPYPTPIFDSEGNVTGGINMLVDITEIKRAEESLAKRVREQTALYQFSEKLQRANSLSDVYESALDAIVHALNTPRASILLFDDGDVMRFVGWRGLSDAYRQAVEGHSPWEPDAIDPQPLPIEDVELADLPESLKEVVRAEGIRSLAFIPLVSEGRLIGKFMVYYDTVHGFQEDELDLGLTIGRHVAFAVDRKRTDEERRQAQQALLASEERYRAIVESQIEMVCRFRADGSILFVNGAYARSRGTTPEALMNTNFWDFIPTEDRSKVRAQLDTLTRETPETRIENQFETADGICWTLWINRALAFDENGRVTEAQSTGIDITERKRAEDELRTSEARLRELSGNLEDLVRERTAELMQANEQLQGFTYSVAHDLRQQIRGINTNAAMLMLDATDVLDKENLSTLSMLVSSSKKLGLLIDDLLNYARLGKKEPAKEPFDMTALTQEVATYLVESGCCREARFVIAPGMHACGDVPMIRLALENLLENACKFSAERESPSVEVGEEDGVFFVRDNGIGFDMQYVHKLFKPFERLHRGSEYTGTGIGLANVKRIVEKHGGDIWATGELGEGATFYFTLPSN